MPSFVSDISIDHPRLYGLCVIGPLAFNRKGDHHMFSLTSSNIAQTQGRDSSDRQRHWTTPSVKIIAAAAIALLASVNTLANAAENSSRMALEQHACAVVMGLHQPGDLYDTCIRSLDRSLSEWDQERLIVSDRSACAQSGLEPGTPAFAVCVVNARKFLGNAGHNQPIVPAH
jgi:hypothetical protein